MPHLLSLPCLTVAVAIGSLGCAPPPINISQKHAKIALAKPFQKDAIEPLYIRERKVLRQGKQPKVGLALSGGGVRSTCFSIGVMKGIWDIDDGKTFSEIDVISSVSGGSYASLWLYNREIASKKKRPFGEATFSDKNYERHLAHLGQANRFKMFSFKRILGNIFIPRYLTVRDYENRINRTWGDGLSKSDRLTFGEFREYIDSHPDAPYPVINTKLMARSPRTMQRVRASKTVEFTTTHIGNPEFRRVRPFEEYRNERVAQAVAISGAAFAPMMFQPYRNWADNGPAPYFPLSDGGGNENLGVLPLVRRGVEKIIVVDGEHSANYTFSGLKQLEKNLRSIGLQVHFPELEEFRDTGYCDRKNPLRKAVFRGLISQASDSDSQLKQPIQITYIRMANSISVGNPNGPARRAGVRERLAGLRKSGVIKYSPSEFAEIKALDEERKGYWNLAFSPEAGNLGPSGKHRLEDFHDIGACQITVRCYSDWLNYHSPIRKVGRLFTALNYSFPQMSTLDQNLLKPDKPAALLSLGYLQGRALASIRR